MHRNYIVCFKESNKISINYLVTHKIMILYGSWSYKLKFNKIYRLWQENCIITCSVRFYKNRIDIKLI